MSLLSRLVNLMRLFLNLTDPKLLNASVMMTRINTRYSSTGLDWFGTRPARFVSSLSQPSPSESPIRFDLHLQCLDLL